MTSTDRRRTRLLLITESFYPVYAGPAVRFRRYLPGFRERGIDVTVVTGTPKGSKAGMSGFLPAWRDAEVGSFLPVEEVDGAAVHRIRLPDEGRKQRGVWFRRRATELALRADLKPDVVQFLSYGGLWIHMVNALRDRGIGTVFTGTMVSEPPPNPLKRHIQRFRLIRPLDRVDRVVVSSSVMKEMMARWRMTDSIDVIPNGVDLERFHPSRDPSQRRTIRSGWGVPKNATVTLFVGPISPRKGVDLLLKAWAVAAREQPNLHLVLAGPRRDLADPALSGFRDILERLKSESGAADRVHFIGLIENVEEHMRAADQFVFSSQREGMPNVIPEAMATGLAVLTTPFVGLPAEFGAPERDYLLTNFDPQALGTSMARLAGDRALRERIGSAARRWAESEMAVRVSLDRYSALYTKLATDGRSDDVSD